MLLSWDLNCEIVVQTENMLKDMLRSRSPSLSPSRSKGGMFVPLSVLVFSLNRMFMNRVPPLSSSDFSVSEIPCFHPLCALTAMDDVLFDCASRYSMSFIFSGFHCSLFSVVQVRCSQEL